MTAITKWRIGLAACCCIVAAGCAPKDESVPAAKDPGVTVSCIAVMPVRPASDFDEAASPEEQKALKLGSQVLDNLLKQALAGKAKVWFAAQQPNQAGESKSAPANLESARRIADQHSCNVVLETTISQYTDRVGGDYGVKRPAAVTFAYKLYETEKGKVLCRGQFDEQQQSVMENLLTLPKAQSRGLTWLTAEELARDGLREKLGQCSYFEGK